jgi:ATP/maltotriose-dependent transcriptional regulator MalT
MLLTKLNRPIMSPGLIERLDLLQKIGNKRHVPLVLVSAPAGFGKSVLINQWINHNQSNYAWISLDENMNDSKIFIVYFIEMLKKAGVEDKKKLKKLLEEHHLLSWEAIISVIINIINEFQHKTILILDDYYLIKNEEIHQLFETLLKERLSNLQLVIITRWDPPFKLSNLRLYQEILEIRMRDLRFNHHEITQLLPKEHGMDLSQDDIKQLLNKTEGWILAIRLVLFAKSFHNFEDKDFDSSILTADLDRLMLLISENIDPNFFRQMQLCALCDEFNEDLINVICEFAFPDSCKGNVFISKLKSLNFFLIPLFDDHKWYRFHHLIGDILRRQLESNEPALINPLYIKISEWFSENNLIDKAIHYAIKAKNYELACERIKKHRTSILDQGDWWVVQRWLNQIPRQIREANVDLLLTELLICEETWNIEDFSHILDRLKSIGIENSSDENISRYLFHLGYFLTYFKPDPEKAVESLERSKALYHDESYMFGGRRELILACSKQMLGLTGLALKSLEDIEEQCKTSSKIHVRATHGKVLIHLLSGNFESAYNDAKKLLFLVRDTDLSYAKGWSLYFQGNVAFQYYNEYEAEHVLQGAIALEGMFNLRVYFDAMAGLILLSSLKGDEKATELLLMQMNQMATRLKDNKFQNYYYSVRARVRWHAGQGDKDLSWALIDWANQNPSTYFFLIDVPELTKIRIVVSHGSVFQVKEALRVIAEIETRLNDVHNGYQRIDIEILKAMALLRIGDKKQAAESLEIALVCAESSNLKRPILEAYRVMPSLFSLVSTSKISASVLARLGLNSSTFNAPTPTGPAVENLSRREEEVVKLIANGLTNKEVAGQLHISISTVKCHMTNVYRKLDVSNRTSMLRAIRSQSIIS